MSIIAKMRKQQAVYWPLASSESGGDDYDDYGQPIVSDPSEVECRWEDVAEEFVGADGTRQISHSKVYVSEDVDVGGILMLGNIDDIVNSDNPKENEGAWEIKRFDKMPNLKATEFLRIAFL